LNKANIFKNLGKIHQLAFYFVMAERKKTVYLTAAMKLALINCNRELDNWCDSVLKFTDIAI
jgi:hypothetical protein